MLPLGNTCAQPAHAGCRARRDCYLPPTALDDMQLFQANQERFRAAEGFELMLRCVHESGFSRFGALRALSHAVAGNAVNCAAFVDAGGLKALFPSFMGKGE